MMMSGVLETLVWPSVGETEDTVKVVVVVSSVVVVLSVVVVSSVAPEDSSILLDDIPSSSYVICPQEFKNIPRMITKVIETN
jgi:hypothetical protein